MIRVVLVDDQHLVREGMRALLARAEDITVVGDAADGEAAVRLVIESVPDVVLMDIRMPGTDGLAATRRIVQDPELRDVQIVVLTTFDTDENVIEAVRSGAAGFLLKDTSPEQMREAVRIVAAGEALLAPSVTRRVMRAAAMSPRSPATDRLAELTERERQVLAEVGACRSNGEIAEQLYISPATVRTHVGRLLTKLDARDRSRLVALAYETGLITPTGG